MRIGIDARLLSITITGMGRYTAELSRELLNLGDECFLYSPSPLIVGDWSRSNAHVRANRVRGRPGRMLWMQTMLPYQAARDQVDVFWGANHRLPRYLSKSMARVVTIHDLVWKYAGETMRPLGRMVESYLMPEAIAKADRIIAVSSATGQAVEAEFPEARGKVRVVLSGVTPMAAPLDRVSLLALGIDRPYFLFVGTLEPRKNLTRLLDAYASLPEAIRVANQLVIVGGKGWGGVNINQLLQARGLEQYAVVPGYVSDAQLSSLYAHARFLALPALYEGFGLPLVEAMAHGVPVLTSNTSSLPEVAGDAGLLVDPLDVGAIAVGIQRLLGDDAYHAELAARARPNAARFSWATAARETREVFEEAVQERRSILGLGRS